MLAVRTDANSTATPTILAALCCAIERRAGVVAAAMRFDMTFSFSGLLFLFAASRPCATAKRLFFNHDNALRRDLGAVGQAATPIHLLPFDCLVFCGVERA
jgi:hypothetical protein